MLQKLISAGDKAEVSRYQTKSYQDSQNEVYLSKVMDFKDTDKVCLTLPIKNNRAYVLDINEIYYIYFYTKTGVYQSRMKVVNRYIQGALRLVVLKMESPLEKVQRRQFYRLACLNDIEFQLIKEEMITEKKDKLNEIKTFERGVMIDLSGGGCKFSSEYYIECGNCICLRFYLSLLSGMTQFLLIGKIVAVNKQEKKAGFYEYRIMFLNMEEDVREKIVRYIFEEDRKQRRRDKGLN